MVDLEAITKKLTDLEQRVANLEGRPASGGLSDDTRKLLDRVGRFLGRYEDIHSAEPAKPADPPQS